MESHVQAKNLPLAVFIAPGLRGAVVALAPEDINYDMGNYGEADEHKITQFDKNRKAVSFKSIEFDRAGRYECHDKRIADALRQHHKFGLDFEEIDADVLFHDVFRAKLPDGGLTQEDHKMVEEIRGMIKATTLPPNGIGGLCNRIEKLVQRFDVRNFDLPREGAKLKTAQGRAEELLDLLEEMDLLKLEPDEGRGDS